ncbi:hypothetical protein F0L68_41400, partial [Solihabitans fulvus]
MQSRTTDSATIWPATVAGTTAVGQSALDANTARPPRQAAAVTGALTPEPRQDARLAGDQPTLLAAAPAPHFPAARSAATGPRTVASAPTAVPKGWPAKPASSVWSWMAGQRPPMAVMVAGAEGGLGTSLVTAPVGETVAGASPCPPGAVDPGGAPRGGPPP